LCVADNAYRVMVASDAVGMGLNLNIRRVIFHSVTKHEGGLTGGGCSRFCVVTAAVRSAATPDWGTFPLWQGADLNLYFQAAVGGVCMPAASRRAAALHCCPVSLEVQGAISGCRSALAC
jgi:hypothetical protein